MCCAGLSRPASTGLRDPPRGARSSVDAEAADAGWSTALLLWLLVVVVAIVKVVSREDTGRVRPNVVLSGYLSTARMPGGQGRDMRYQQQQTDAEARLFPPPTVGAAREKVARHRR